MQKKIKDKVWKPKTVVTFEGIEPEKEDTPDTKEKWIEVSSGKGDRGKKPLMDNVSPTRGQEVLCNTSFHSLQIGDSMI